MPRIFTRAPGGTVSTTKPADLPSSGQFTITVGQASNTAVTMTSGALVFTYFEAVVDQDVSSLTTWQGSTTGASLTLVRHGLWREESNGDLTPIATTASSTTIYTQGNANPYGPLTLAPVSGTPHLTRGTRYAYGVLITGTTMPSLVGMTLATGALSLAGGRRWSAQLTGQTDLPAGTVTNAALTAAGTNNRRIFAWVS